MWGVNDMKCLMRCLRAILATLLLVACEAEEIVSLGPLKIDEVTSDAVYCRFEISGDIPVDCGFCYATTKIAAESWTASKVQGDYGQGDVMGVIEGLQPNTTYFVRGYTMTVRGRVYTETLSVKTTLRTPQAGDNEYPDIEL